MINLFQPSPDFQSLKFIKNIFKKKYFHKDIYCRLFLKEFYQFQNLNKKKLVLGASCSDLIFNILFTCKNLIKKKLVIVPANSFPAVPSAVVRAGLKLKIIDIENDNIIHEILVGMVLNNLREYTPNFMYTYGGFICSPPIDRTILNKKENYRGKVRGILEIPEKVYDLYLELIEDEGDDYEVEEIDDKSVFLEYLPTLITVLKNYIRKCINNPSYRYIRLIKKELTEVLEQTKFFRKNPKNLKKDQDMLDLYLTEIKIFLEKVDYKHLEIYIDFINENEDNFDPDLLCSTDDKAVLLLSEFFDDTMSFHEFINTRHNKEDLSNIMLQIIISLIIAYKQYGFKHNDLHRANVLIQERDCELTYNLSGKIITLKSRYVTRIIDYGLSHITYNGKTIIPSDEDLYLDKIDTKDLTELLRHLDLDMFSPFIQGCLSLDTYEEMEKYILNNFTP